jgi:SAM-dependent methyltransferase
MSQDIRLYGSAEVWDQPLQTGQRNLLQAIRDFWPAGIASVLDIGCGDGKLTSSLAKQHRDALFVGLDSSDEALSRLPFTGVKGDAQALPFADAAFDLVMSTDALEHMPEATEAAAWSELFRVAGKAVMVAVPFREELLDATTCCASCGHRYHVNWHQRSYDFSDLHRRAPIGWSVHSTVLAGEPWSAMLPPETHLRRSALDQWAGWSAAICPECGANGQPADPLEPLSPLLARALGRQLYPALLEQRYCRSHSEVLVVFQRQPLTFGQSPAAATQHLRTATCVDFANQPMASNLAPFCQVAQYVTAADGGWRLQFPLYEAAPLLEVRRRPGSQGELHLSLEDAAGLLLEGCVLEAGQDHATLALPRAPVAGYYGILASCESEAFASVRLGEGPVIAWAQPAEPETHAYWRCEQADHPLFVQVTTPSWLDAHALTAVPSPLTPTPAAVIGDLQNCFEEALSQIPPPATEDASAQVGELQARLQNLGAERDSLLKKAQKAEAMSVQLQNLTAERDALLARAREADRLAVQNQNLAAEYEILLEKAERAEAQAVQLQNLTAERDTLVARAREADRLAVQHQNFTAEHHVLREKARLAESQAVQLQNLIAERDALLERAREADQLAVQIQNLSAERDTLLEKARMADAQSVQLQNLGVERDALLERAREADRLAVQLQNLSAERDALLERTREADRLAVQLQNLSAERDTLLERVRAVDAQSVQLQNLIAERDTLLERTRRADTLAVQLQNLSAERDTLLERVQEADARSVHLQNLAAERDALLERTREADTLAVQLQNLSAERDTLLERVQAADARSVQLQNLTAERDALLERAREADRLAVQLQNLAAEHADVQAREAMHDRARNELDATVATLEEKYVQLSGRLRETEEQLERRNDELNACKARLEQLSQHIENRLGTMARHALAKLPGKP